MKCLLPVLLLAVSTSAIALPRIAVVDFDTNEYSGQLSGDQLADYVMDELVNSGLFEVVEREKLDSTMREVGFTQSGMVDPSSAASFGKQLGAGYLLTGRVISVDRESKSFNGYGVSTKNTVMTLSVSVRIVDVATGSIKFSTRSNAQAVFNEGGGLSIDSSNPFRQLAESAAETVVSEIMESGRFKSSRTDAIPEAGRMVSVMVKSSPDGADVEVDGVFYGNTGGALKIREGLRRIRISLAGHMPWEKQVMVSEGSAFTATLAPIPDQ